MPTRKINVRKSKPFKLYGKTVVKKAHTRNIKVKKKTTRQTSTNKVDGKIRYEDNVFDLRENTYHCYKCDARHYYTSKKGRSHLRKGYNLPSAKKWHEPQVNELEMPKDTSEFEQKILELEDELEYLVQNKNSYGTNKEENLKRRLQIIKTIKPYSKWELDKNNGCMDNRTKKFGNKQYVLSDIIYHNDVHTNLDSYLDYYEDKAEQMNWKLKVEKVPNKKFGTMYRFWYAPNKQTI